MTRLLSFSLILLWSVTAQASLTPLEKEIVALTNQARQKAGLQPLKINLTLVGAARAQCTNMIAANQLSHAVNGKTLPVRIKNWGYAYKHIGENIAFGDKSATRIMKLWMKSKGHRQNILNKNFNEIGVGVATDRHGRVYYTQVFGKRR